MSAIKELRHALTRSSVGPASCKSERLVALGPAVQAWQLNHGEPSGHGGVKRRLRFGIPHTRSGVVWPSNTIQEIAAISHHPLLVFARSAARHAIQLSKYSAETLRERRRGTDSGLPKSATVGSLESARQAEAAVRASKASVHIHA